MHLNVFLVTDPDMLRRWITQVCFLSLDQTKLHHELVSHRGKLDEDNLDSYWIYNTCPPPLP